MLTTKSIAFIILSVLPSTYMFAQDTQQPVSTDISTKPIVPFYKWELGLDALPLIDKAKDSFGYVLKRNFQKENGRQALRLKLLPRFGYSSVGGTVSNSSVYLAVGYEWQKLYGRFAVLYGLEPFFRYDHNLVAGQNINARSEAKQINTGLSGFVGGRYYIGNHFSVSVESHLIYNFYSGKITNSGNISSGDARQHIELFNPIHAVYFSYHF